MTEIPTEFWPIASSEDVVKYRQAVKRIAGIAGFGLVDQTKIVTAASEIARNALDYGGGGSGSIDVVERSGRTGIRLMIKDDGPGIADLSIAMQDGYTSGPEWASAWVGAKRLANEFEIETQPGQGTMVTITRWR